MLIVRDGTVGSVEKRDALLYRRTQLLSRAIRKPFAVVSFPTVARFCSFNRLVCSRSAALKEENVQAGVRRVSTHSLVPSFSRLSDVQLATQLSWAARESGATETRDRPDHPSCPLTTRDRANLFIGRRENRAKLSKDDSHFEDAIRFVFPR